MTVDRMCMMVLARIVVYHCVMIVPRKLMAEDLMHVDESTEACRSNYQNLLRNFPLLLFNSFSRTIHFPSSFHHPSWCSFLAQDQSNEAHTCRPRGIP